MLVTLAAGVTERAAVAPKLQAKCIFCTGHDSRANLWLVCLLALPRSTMATCLLVAEYHSVKITASRAVRVLRSSHATPV